MAKLKSQPVNPFFTGIDIPDEYFCDRKEETKELIKYIKNGNNIVLKAPRRIGKSSLIKHLFAQGEILNTYNTLYVDIFGTGCARDFQLELQNAFMASPFAKRTKLFKKIVSYAKTMRLELGTVEQNGFRLPSIGFEDPKDPIFSIPDIFETYEEADRPGLIVFDEFQQIEEYPERMAASLRSLIQQMNNTKFIFSGSSRHMLNTMFLKYNQPFYKSATTIDLDIISLPAYREFVLDIFSSYGKTIKEEAVDFTYYVMSGNTFGMQEVMKEVFSNAALGSITDKEDIIAAIKGILKKKDSEYREVLNRVNSIKDRNTLFCIAALGVAQGMTSGAVMKRYNLDNASSVQHSLANLSADKLDMIQTISKGTYILQDRLFELWIAFRGNYLDSKFDDPRARFEKERHEAKSLPTIPGPR